MISTLRFDPKQVQPVELLLAGAQFQKAADAITDSPLKSDFVAAADQLFETGLQRLDKQHEARTANK
jgi:hypothetical protein